MEFTSKFVSGGDDVDDSIVIGAIQKRYSDQSETAPKGSKKKGQYIPLFNKAGETNYIVEVLEDRVNLVFHRKSDSTKGIIESIDNNKNFKIGKLVLSPFVPLEESSEKFSPEEWLEILSQDFGWKDQFCHNGIVFYGYKAHGIPFVISGEEYSYPSSLSRDEELVLTLYANRLYSEQKNEKNTKHTESDVFNKNYVQDLQDYLNPEIYGKIDDISSIDFSQVVDHLQQEGSVEKTREMALEKKREKLRLNKHYGWVTVDGRRQKFTSYNIDVPGLFLGRDNKEAKEENKRKGKIKKLYLPSDITINVDRDCKIPQPPNPDSDNVPKEPGNIPWGRVVHDNSVGYVASYWDPVTKSHKHRYTTNESIAAAKNDFAKFNNARRLHLHIDEIRKAYTSNLDSKNKEQRELAVILWLIDNAAIRVGGEKKEEEVDTVGATTLKVENVSLNDNGTITLDFLGKDSVRYENTFDVPKKVYKAIKSFTVGKKPTSKLFSVSAAKINKYLKTFDSQLTAKVFRTYHASRTFEERLNEKEIDPNVSDADKMLAFQSSNIEVAKLCNHRRGVNVAANQAERQNANIAKIKDAISNAKTDKQKEKAKERLRIAKKKLGLISEGGEITCTTSKANYIDPRISIAWSKKVNLKPEKLFSKSLQNKYDWALKTTTEEFSFIPTNEEDLAISSPSPRKTPKKVRKESPKKPLAKPSKKLFDITSFKGNVISDLKRINSNLSKAIDILSQCVVETSKNTNVSTELVFDVLSKFLSTSIISFVKSNISKSFWTFSTGGKKYLGTSSVEVLSILKEEGFTPDKNGIVLVKNDFSLEKLPQHSLFE